MQELDHRIVAWMSGLDWPVVTPLMKLASAVGRGALVFLVIALVLAVVRRRPAIAVATLAAVLVSQVAYNALKYTIDRPRPSVTYADVHPLIATPNSPAMPSGHAWEAFAAATVLAAAAPRLRVPVFGLAALIAISRVYLGVHYPSDVVVGAAGGVLTGLLTVDIWRRLAARRGRSAA
jgi:undecaprenyl-diphosphatase